MHILIDGRMLSWTGIGTYIRNIAHRLPRLDSTCRFTLVANPGDDCTFPRGIDLSILGSTIPVYSLREQLLLAAKLGGADLVHFPHFTVPLAFKGPFVVTIHDLVYFLFRDACPSWVGYRYARLMYPRAAARARWVITDSEFTRGEILKHLDVAKDRVRVIYPGVDGERFRPVPGEQVEPVVRRLGITKPYLLYVGNQQRRKNILDLIHSYAYLKRRGDYQLVIAGPKDRRRSELETTIQRLGLRGDVLMTGWVALEELPALYSGASCFVFPSLYEGFGLPVLEAMSCGTPVVATNASSLPEVVGDAGLLVEPGKSSSLRAAIEDLLDSRSLREELAEKGAQRAKEFSWDVAAKETLRVYQEALGRS